MNNAPAVFVPTQPEGDGLKLPTLLSLLAHGVILGLLIYNFQSPVLESAGSIETVMVSPEQLADMQGQILANRAATEAAQLSSGAISDEPFNPNDMTVAGPNSSESTSQQVPLTMRSDQARREDYEASMEAFRAETNQEALGRIQAPLDEAHERYLEEQEQLSSFKHTQNNPPKIERPTSSSRNVEITAGSSGSEGEGKNYSLSDGQSTTSNDSSASSSPKGSSGSSGSSATDNDIRAMIRRNFFSPEGQEGKSATTMLTITVNSSGQIIKVDASGNNPLFDAAVEKAARDTGSLPIGPDDRKYPTFRIQYVGKTK